MFLYVHIHAHTHICLGIPCVHLIREVTELVSCRCYGQYKRRCASSVVCESFYSGVFKVVVRAFAWISESFFYFQSYIAFPIPLNSPTLIIFMLYSHPLWSSSCSTLTHSDHLYALLSPTLILIIFMFYYHPLWSSSFSTLTPSSLLHFLFIPSSLLLSPFQIPISSSSFSTSLTSFLFFYLYFIPTFCFTKIDVLIIIFFLKAGRGIGYVPHEIYVHVNAEVKYSSKLKFTF